MISVCIVSIIRVPSIAHISLTDPSWSDVYGAIWSIVELNIGIVSACLPTLKPLFTWLIDDNQSLDMKTSTLRSEDALRLLRRMASINQ